jgi:anaerobic selenocysteine-containing dehydrogenase
VPPEVFARVCELVTDNSGPERTTALVYSVGWTQHTVGAQYIRTAAILQLLLGNIGRPGGGIPALRGHASIQGSTDIPTLRLAVLGAAGGVGADQVRHLRGGYGLGPGPEVHDRAPASAPALAQDGRL